MKRSGFTMIELIFVIVILGILAAVAIPRLAATRDDAQIARVATDAATVISDFGARYTSQGTWAGNLSDITNVAVTDNAGAAIDSAAHAMADGDVLYLSDSNANTCLSVTVHSVADGNLTVADAGGAGQVCPAVATRAVGLIKTHSFGGTGVVQ